MLKNSIVYFLIFLYLIITGCTDSITVLDRIKESGELRFVTVNNLSSYIPAPGTDKGFEHDLARKFADYLGVDLKLIVVNDKNKIPKMINTGKATIGAANFVNIYSYDNLQFGPEYYRVSQQVVYRYGTREPVDVDDIRIGELIITEIPQYVHLMVDVEKLHPQLPWETRSDKDIEELLELVNKEEVRATIANSIMVDLYRNIYPELRVAFNLTKPQSMVWIYRKQQDNSLHNAVMKFFNRIKKSGELNSLIERYFNHFNKFDYVDVRTYLERIYDRLPEFEPLFRETARKYDLDWVLLAAMSYQESHWDPAARSPTGVRGLMMLTLDTAKHLDVNNRLDPEQSIDGGARYFIQTYENIPARIPEPDRTWLALAAYNIGYAHLEDARKLTQKRGMDPDSWIDVRKTLPLLSQEKWYRQTRYGKARGEEPVDYVENIRRYYDILRWIKYRKKVIDKKETYIQALTIDPRPL